MTNYDAIIIGSGQAGPYLAGRMTGTGMKVAMSGSTSAAPALTLSTRSVIVLEILAGKAAE